MKFLFAYDKDLNYISGLEKYRLLDFKGAIDDYNRAIESNPNHPWAYNSRGEAKRKLNDFNGAIANYSTAIENYPTHAGGYILRGYARYKLGDKDGALMDWNMAGELGEKDAYYLIRLFIY